MENIYYEKYIKTRLASSFYSSDFLFIIVSVSSNLFYHMTFLLINPTSKWYLSDYTLNTSKVLYAWLFGRYFWNNYTVKNIESLSYIGW